MDQIIHITTEHNPQTCVVTTLLRTVLDDFTVALAMASAATEVGAACAGSLFAQVTVYRFPGYLLHPHECKNFRTCVVFLL